MIVNRKRSVKGEVGRGAAAREEGVIGSFAKYAPLTLIHYFSFFFYTYRTVLFQTDLEKVDQERRVVVSPYR